MMEDILLPVLLIPTLGEVMSTDSIGIRSLSSRDEWTIIRGSRTNLDSNQTNNNWSNMMLLDANISAVDGTGVTNGTGVVNDTNTDNISANNDDIILSLENFQLIKMIGTALILGLIILATIVGKC
jgi:hypothetical protein